MSMGPNVWAVSVMRDSGITGFQENIVSKNPVKREERTGQKGGEMNELIRNQLGNWEAGIPTS